MLISVLRECMYSKLFIKSNYNCNFYALIISKLLFIMQCFLVLYIYYHVIYKFRIMHNNMRQFGNEWTVDRQRMLINIFKSWSMVDTRFRLSDRAVLHTAPISSIHDMRSRTCILKKYQTKIEWISNFLCPVFRGFQVPISPSWRESLISKNFNKHRGKIITCWSLCN